MEDFDALAQEFGGTAAPSAGQDFDALAAETGGQVAAPAPVSETAPLALRPEEAEIEFNRMLRRGATTPELQAFVQRLRNPATDQPYGGQGDWSNVEEARKYVQELGGQEPIRFDAQVLGPDGQPSTNAGSVARGFADVALLNYADELEAFVEAGTFSGEEFDAALVRRMQRRMADDPDFRGLGKAAGVGASMVLPGGAVSRVAGLRNQMFVGAGVGAGMNALAGIGAAEQGNRFETVGEDAVFGAVTGFAAPAVAGTGRKLVQMFAPGDGVNQTAANDILQGAGLDPAELRRRAEVYFQSTGRGARITDILTPDEAKRFTGPLSRSEGARDRVMGELETARTDLPQGLAGRATTSPLGGPQQIIGPEEIRRRANDAADVEFGAVAGRNVNLDSFGRQFMLDDVLPYVNLPRLTRDQIRNTLEQGGDLSVADMDAIRRALSKSGGVSIGGVPYERMAGDIQDEVTAQVPAYGEAVENMARRLSVADGGDPRFLGGAELGRAAVGDAPTSDVLAAMRRQSPEGAEGAALGARSGVFNAAIESPGKSYALARRLQEDPGLRQRLQATLGQAEADDLIAFATAQKQGVDAIASLARIPQDKIETLLDSTEEMTDAVVAAGLGAGGAFKAGILNSILARTNIGRGAADRLAEDLLNPARRERVIELLERAGLPKTGLREVVQAAFIATGVAISTADREPEGIPVPQETVTMGVPQ
jgi:hypothetical protein